MERISTFEIKMSALAMAILFLKMNRRFWTIQDVSRALAMATHPDFEAKLLADEEYDQFWAEEQQVKNDQHEDKSEQLYIQ